MFQACTPSTTQQDLVHLKVDMLSFYFSPQDVANHALPTAGGVRRRTAGAGHCRQPPRRRGRGFADRVEYARKIPLSPSPMPGAAPPVHPGMTDNINAQMGDEEIDEELATLARARAPLITHKVVHQRISQSPMETRGVVAVRDGAEELTLYITCQSPHLVARWVLARARPAADRDSCDRPGRGRSVRAQESPVEGRGRGHPRRAEIQPAIEMDRGSLRRTWSPPTRAREQEMLLQVAFDNAARLDRLAWRLQRQRRCLSPAVGMQYRGPHVPVGGLTRCLPNGFLNAAGTATRWVRGVRGPWAMNR